MQVGGWCEVTSLASRHREGRTFRAPDAAQRVALAERCAAEPGPRLLATRETEVPVLRSGMKNAASRPGHEIRDSNFKQPSFYILAAQCVRALPVPRYLREAMERREAPGCLRGTLGGGINGPTSRGKATARAQGRRCASRRSTWPSACRPFRGAPVRPAFALSAEGSLLESAPHRTGHGQDKPGFGNGDRDTFTSA
jgi:hypothetical protein